MNKMRVYRIVKACIKIAVGEVVRPHEKEHNYSVMRSKAEAYLEDVRKEKYATTLSRLNSLFVFPKDEKLQERAFQWARTFAPTPSSSCVVNLLELEVDNVEWHDVRFYEDLCFLLDDKKYEMRNSVSTKESLSEEYWQGNCDMGVIDVEGLVEKGKVVAITSYLVTHNNIKELE